MTDAPGRGGRPLALPGGGRGGRHAGRPVPAAAAAPVGTHSILLARQARMEHDLKAILDDLAAAEPVDPWAVLRRSRRGRSARPAPPRPAGPAPT